MRQSMALQTSLLLGEGPRLARPKTLSLPSLHGYAPEAFLSVVIQFSDFGTKTQEVDEAGIPYLINEFWTAGQRQAHSIHEISYRACFKPQLPEFFISRLTKEGDAVHDPFMGRGTTPIQAALMGRKPVGNDINPLSILLTRPRLAPPTLTTVARAVSLRVSVAAMADIVGAFSWAETVEATSEGFP